MVFVVLLILNQIYFHSDSGLFKRHSEHFHCKIILQIFHVPMNFDK